METQEKKSNQSEYTQLDEAKSGRPHQ